MQQLVELQLWGACDWNDEAYEGPWEEEGSRRDEKPHPLLQMSLQLYLCNQKLELMFILTCYKVFKAIPCYVSPCTINTLMIQFCC